MGRCYDNWERLVEAVMRREQLRTLSLADSMSSSFRSSDSDFSLSSSFRHENSSFTATPSPLRADLVRIKLAQTVKETKQRGRELKVPAKLRNSMWKGLSIFSGFNSKKDYGREEREAAWIKAQRTLHGLEPVKITAVSSKHRFEEVSAIELAKRRAEIARLREAHTLKGHVESLVKMKGLDIDSINMLREAHTLKGHVESLVKMKGLAIGSINMYYTV